MITTRPGRIAVPRKLGWIPDLPDHRDLVFKVSAPAQSFPSTCRLVWMPGALDQGSLGSCTANAVAGLVHYDRIRQREVNSWSPSRLFNYYNARALWGWENEDTGAYIRDAVKSASNQGSLPEELYPYDVSKFREKPPQEVYNEAFKCRALAYRRVGQTVNDMKGCLAEGFPFVFGFSIYENFPWSGNGDVPLPSGALLGGHAVVCMGYDDATQRFLFLNSWGQQWGKLGRGTIGYDYLTSGNANDFWQISRA